MVNTNFHEDLPIVTRLLKIVDPIFLATVPTRLYYEHLQEMYRIKDFSSINANGYVVKCD